MKPTLCYAKLAFLGPSMMKPATYLDAKKLDWIEPLSVDDTGHLIVGLTDGATRIPSIEPRDIEKMQVPDKKVGDRIYSSRLDAYFIFNGTFWVET